MSKTLRFGQYVTPRLTSRIDRFVVRRRTTDAFEAHAELAYQFAMQEQLDEAKRSLHARTVARQVSPTLVRANGGRPVGFGKREH